MALDFAFGAAPQIGIEFFRLGNWLLGDFVDGRGRGLLFAETVPVAEGLELILAHCVDNVVVQARSARDRHRGHIRWPATVERLVKLLAGLAECRPRNPARPHRTRPGFARQAAPGHPALNDKRRQSLVLRIERQRGKNLVCAMAKRSGRAGLARRPGRIFTSGQAEKHTCGDK